MSDSPASEPDAALTRALAADGLADAELVRLLVQVEALGRRVDAARVRLAGEVAHRSRRELGPDRLSARLGCRNAVEVVQRTTGVSGPAAGRRMRLGTATRRDVGLSGEPVAPRFAAVGAALGAGALGVDAAHAIVAALEPTLRVADPAHVAKGERELVDAATETWAARRGPDAPDADDRAEAAPSADLRSAPDPHGCLVVDADDVRLQARLWAEYLDPDRGAPDDRDEERRFVTLHAPRHGLVPISGLLLPQVAAGLKTYADAWTNPRTAPVPEPGATGDTEPVAAPASQQPDAPGETRSRTQVLHDVLATALSVAARAADAPTVAGNAPTLVLVAREHDLRTGDGVARTEDGSAVSLGAARHVGCAGAVQRVSVDVSGRVAGLWSPLRCFTGPQRRAIAVRDGGCVIPGCHVPAGWCEVHHVVPHADDPGGTTTDNGVLLCWHHHRTIESSGWMIRMVAGVPWVKPPGWLDRAGSWRPARPSQHVRA